CVDLQPQYYSRGIIANNIYFSPPFCKIGMLPSISAIFPLQKDSLFYFRTHVGGTDPAEPYHIQMTSRMIEKIVSENQIGDFLKAFENAYALNYFWCRDITKIQ
ncbi:hypothetical protein, partial [Nostoc sp.]|uniref:hypothetical protein n=1 Tax=Nostoc sp. TaxID=1180 RepID=UPI002FF2F8FA